MESKMEYILASIFDTFQWILGGKLGGKIEPKVIQKGIEKMIKAAGGFGIVLVRFQEIWEWTGGGGFRRSRIAGPLRGRK